MAEQQRPPIERPFRGLTSVHRWYESWGGQGTDLQHTQRAQLSRKRGSRQQPALLGVFQSPTVGASLSPGAHHARDWIQRGRQVR